MVVEVVLVVVVVVVVVVSSSSSSSSSSRWGDAEFLPLIFQCQSPPQ